MAAGEHLVHHCPTWQWARGEEGKARSYLPADKQFLITRNVPCYRRCKQVYTLLFMNFYLSRILSLFCPYPIIWLVQYVFVIPSSVPPSYCSLPSYIYHLLLYRVSKTANVNKFVFQWHIVKHPKIYTICDNSNKNTQSILTPSTDISL